MELREEKTVAALSTAPGAAGLDVIRVSGPDAGKIVARIFDGGRQKPFWEGPTHRAHHGWIRDGAGQRVDEVLVLWMKGPGTFTGEDTAEINCHGGPYVSRKILELLYEAGAEPARPGEFTQRAFMNGKLDLTQAEAVMDVIASETSLSLRASVSQLGGSLFEKTEALRSRLMDVMTEAEVNIDYPEYDVPELSTARLLAVCSEISQEAEALYATAETGRLLRQGAKTVILGAPNVGKSSLLNRLLGQERAIVTEIPGTTRDTLEETINIGGIPLQVVDTAGIRDTEDRVEKIGVQKARQALEDCDLVLLVLDGTRALTDEEDELFEEARKKPFFILINKCDVGTLTPEMVAERMSKGFPGEISWEIICRILPVSAKEGTGIDDLQKKIQELLLKGVVVTDHTPLIMNLRQKQALRKASDALKRTLEAGEAGFEQDLLMIDIQEAYDALGEISGHSVREDMVNEIFSRFCLGK